MMIFSWYCYDSDSYYDYTGCCDYPLDQDVWGGIYGLSVWRRRRDAKAFRV